METLINVLLVIITVSVTVLLVLVKRIRYHVDWIMRMANEEVIGDIKKDKVIDDIHNKLIHTNEIMSAICDGVDKLHKALPVFDDRLFNVLDILEERIQDLQNTLNKQQESK